MARAQQSSGADAVAGHFTDKAANYESASSSGIWNAWRAMERRAIWSLLRPQAGEQILDAGCGAGYYTGHLLRAGATVFATDLSLSMTQETARRLRVSAFVSNLERLPITAQFDAVLCAGALEFCSDPAAAIASMAGLISPGGRLILMLPADHLGGRLYRRFHQRHGFAINLFSREWLTKNSEVSRLKLTATKIAGFNHVARFVPA